MVHGHMILALRDRLAAVSLRPHDLGLGKETEKEIAERIRSGVAEMLDRPPVLTFSVGPPEAGGRPGSVGAAWEVDAGEMHSTIEADAQAVSLIVAQMFGAQANATLDAPAAVLRPLDARLAALVARSIVAAVSAVLSDAEPWKLADEVAAGATSAQPERLNISVSGYGAKGTIVLRADKPLQRDDEGASPVREASFVWAESLAHATAQIGVSTRIVLAIPRATLGEIARWRSGDIIPLSGGGSLAVSLMVGPMVVANGELGRDGRRFSVRVDGFPRTAHMAAFTRSSIPSAKDKS